MMYICIATTTALYGTSARRIPSSAGRYSGTRAKGVHPGYVYPSIPSLICRPAYNGLWESYSRESDSQLNIDPSEGPFFVHLIAAPSNSLSVP